LISIQENLENIRAKLGEAAARAGRSLSDITLVAVSKRKPASDVRMAYSAGQYVFGENYVQEAAGKIEALQEIRSALSWHFIGHLQRNKAKRAVELFDFIETVDSLKLLRALGRHASEAGRVMPVLLQVNISGEESKAGMAPEELEPFVDAMLAEDISGVDVQGLMILPPWNPDPEASRPWFARARALREALSERYGSALDLRHLSMGMSGDFQVAVEEGATIVRIGTALFGARDAA
jgi:pyridoxal phosphate enzyme (YggS family)